MFCRAMEIGLLGSRNAYALKEPYIYIGLTIMNSYFRKGGHSDTLTKLQRDSVRYTE